MSLKLFCADESNSSLNDAENALEICTFVFSALTPQKRACAYGIHFSGIRLSSVVARHC